MGAPKTRFTDASVSKFLERIPQERRGNDAAALVRIMQEITGHKPRMFAPTIVGFGQYHYAYPSGHEGDAPLAGFSPRTPDFVVYLAPGWEKQGSLRKKLGKHRAGKVCLYIRRLDEVHIPTLKQLIRWSVA